jgi:hypothetical protein
MKSNPQITQITQRGFGRNQKKERSMTHFLA